MTPYLKCDPRVFDRCNVDLLEEAVLLAGPEAEVSQAVGDDQVVIERVEDQAHDPRHIRYTDYRAKKKIPRSDRDGKQLGKTAFNVCYYTRKLFKF